MKSKSKKKSLWSKGRGRGRSVHARVNKKLTEAQAATAIARARLRSAGFYEDYMGPGGRIEILDTSFNDGTYFVDVRVFIPDLDVEHVADGSITAEDA